jgi:regulatory protein
MSGTEQQPHPGGTITAITPQQRATDRLSVFIDGEFAFGLGVDVVLEYHLAPNMTLTAEQVVEILAKEEVVSCVNAALHLLGYRARSSSEMETRLRQKGYSPPAIAATMAKLHGWHYLDDDDFARQWVANRQSHRPRSRRLLQQELRTKGIDSDTIAAAIDDIEIDEEGDAWALAEAKWAGWRDLDPQTRQRRLASFLGRRGYGFDIVRKVMRRLEHDEEIPDE